ARCYWHRRSTFCAFQGGGGPPPTPRRSAGSWLGRLAIAPPSAAPAPTPAAAPRKLPEPFAGSCDGLWPGRVSAFPRDGLVPRDGCCEGRVPFPPLGRLPD